MDRKTQNGDKKVEKPKGPQYKNGRHPSIKDRLGHIKGVKTNRRKLVNGFECVQFERKKLIGTVQPAQPVAVPRKRAVVPHPTEK
jgi:hypothetical protein